MFCPVCRAEYVRSATTCSDCQVPLVPELPAATSESGRPGDESLVLAWAGMIPQRHAEVVEAFERAGIPARTIHKDDHIFGTSLQSAFNVYVPASLLPKAKEILQEPAVLNAEEENEMADGTEVDELPAEDDFPPEEEHRPARSKVNPEDATVEIWSGEDEAMAGMIGASLQENQIYWRGNDRELDEETPAQGPQVERIFVLPEDEARAREILREIMDGTPL